jgi:hypothetical protein
MISDRTIGLARKYAEPAAVAAVLLGLYLASLFNFLLFFSLVKALIILLSFEYIYLCMNTRRLQEDAFLLVIGYGSLSSALLYLFHALTEGVSMFPGFRMISGRGFARIHGGPEHFLLAASFFLGRKVPCEDRRGLCCSLALLLGAAFLRCSRATDDGKPTMFLHAGGIGIALLYQATIINLLQKDRIFKSSVSPPDCSPAPRRLQPFDCLR